MKKKSIVIFLLFTIPLLSNAQKKLCNTYDCWYKEATSAYEKGEYGIALINFQAARTIDDSKIGFIDNWIIKTISKISEQNKALQKAKEKADEALKQAKIEAENAKQEKLKADEATQKLKQKLKMYAKKEIGLLSLNKK